jgi:hypothetical protein
VRKSYDGVVQALDGHRKADGGDVRVLGFDSRPPRALYDDAFQRARTCAARRGLDSGSRHRGVGRSVS